jgi:hypothetical protein
MMLNSMLQSSNLSLHNAGSEMLQCPLIQGFEFNHEIHQNFAVIEIPFPRFLKFE